MIRTATCLLIVFAVGCGGSDEANSGNGAASPPPKEREGIVGKTTAEVLDLQQVMPEQPRLIVASGEVTGGDPLSAAGSAYTTKAPQLSTLGMQQSIQHFEILNDRWPTYAEFTDMMKRDGVRFAQPPPYQMYAYDSQTGRIVILEDPEEKRRRYEAAGIDPDQ